MARRRRYNRNQKRDYYGRWTAGAAGGGKGSKKTTAYVTGQPSKRYAAYQASVAKKKKQARRKNAAVAATAGAAIAIGAVAYSKRNRTPLSGGVAAPVVPISKFDMQPPTKVAKLSSDISGMGFQPLKKAKVNPDTGVKTTAPLPKMEGAKAPASKKPATTKAKSGVNDPDQKAALTGPTTIAAEAPPKKVPPAKPKKEAKAAGVANPGPTPGVVVKRKRRGKDDSPMEAKVELVKNLDDAQRAELRKRALAANAELIAKLPKNEPEPIRAPSKVTVEAAKKDQERLKRRQEMKEFAATVEIPNVPETFGGLSERRTRAASRYVDIYETMVGKGITPPRSSRALYKAILNDETPHAPIRVRGTTWNTANAAKAKASAEKFQAARTARAKEKYKKAV